MIIFYLLIAGFFAGVFGALLGLGGGVIVIPALTILFDLPIQTAIGVSLVGVIATSTGAAIVYVREGKADIRLGMTLELGTTIGAIIGAVIAGFVSNRSLYLLFASLLLYNSYSMYKKAETEGRKLIKDIDEINLTGKNETASEQNYTVKNIPAGLVLSGFAGVMSGLLGVGGGLIKIPVMYLLMGIPLKVAAATSNFMIGVTATASAFIYYINGNINPVVAVPVALGVFTGATVGLRLNKHMSAAALKKVFIIVFLYVAVEMIKKGFGS